MIVHWHPENRIYIRDEFNKILFEGSPEETAVILGEPLATLPVGIKERQYFVGSHCADFSSNGQEEGPAIWPQGDKIIGKLATYRQAYADFVNDLKDRAIAKPQPEPTPPPPPTPEQIIRAQLVADARLRLSMVKDRTKSALEVSKAIDDICEILGIRKAE